METNKNKRDSVFSGIFPSQEPAPQPVPAQQVHKPVVAEDQVAVLNRKIEQMERSIVGQLEKKLAEQVLPPPPPQPAPGLAPAMLSKMTEMEDRLKDFQEKFLLGAARMKNVEESRVSGRREIEELLKIVREQQKYSELDRQMHDQLEKAWVRVEEMEKRMMDVYTAAAKKPAEPPARGASPAEIAAEVLKAVNAGLEERLKLLETFLENAAARTEAALAAVKKPAELAAEVLNALDTRLEERLAPLETMMRSSAAKNAAATAESRGIEVRAAELSASVDSRLAAFSSEIRQLRIDNFAAKESIEDILTGVRKATLSSVREAFAEESGVFLRHIDAAAIDGRERLDASGKLLISHIDELAVRSRDTVMKLDVLESCIRSGNEKALSSVSTAQYGLEKALRAHIDEAAARVAAENSRQLERIREAYGLSVSNTAAISAVAKNITGIEASLGGVMAGLKSFIRALEPVNLEAVLGVSGAIIRRSLESAGELAAGLEKETVLLARAKGEIEANLLCLSPKIGAEGK